MEQEFLVPCSIQHINAPAKKLKTAIAKYIKTIPDEPDYLYEIDYFERERTVNSFDEVLMLADTTDDL